MFFWNSLAFLMIQRMSFLISGSFPVSQFSTSAGQSIGASASFLPMNIQDWFPLGFTDLISLLSKGLSRIFSSPTVQKHQFFSAQPSIWFNSNIHTWLQKKWYLWLYGPFLAKKCLYFLICCLVWSKLFFQEASIFSFHRCSHHLQWFWSLSK